MVNIFGIKGKYLRIIRNMYEDIKCQLILNGELSNAFDMPRGLSQGDSLSPLLFLFYINDAADFMRENSRIRGVKLSAYIKLFIVLFADDTLLLSDSPRDLQIQLDAFAQYCKTNDLRLNSEKTNIVIFSKDRKPTSPDFFLELGRRGYQVKN